MIRRWLKKIVGDANAAGVPVVCIGDKTKNCIRFRKDNSDAFRMVVRHMLEEHQAERISDGASYELYRNQHCTGGEFSV